MDVKTTSDSLSSLNFKIITLMKNILNFLKKMMVDKRLGGLFFALLIFAGCSVEDNNPIPATERFNTASSDASARILDIPEVIQLEGVSTFYIYAEKEKLEIVNVSGLCLATLTHVEGQQYILETDLLRCTFPKLSMLFHSDDDFSKRVLAF